MEILKSAHAQCEAQETGSRQTDLSSVLRAPLLAKTYSPMNVCSVPTTCELPEIQRLGRGPCPQEGYIN